MCKPSNDNRGEGGIDMGRRQDPLYQLIMRRYPGISQADAKSIADELMGLVRDAIYARRSIIIGTGTDVVEHIKTRNEKAKQR